MSKLSDVLANFGFDSAEKQIAVLENLALARYFENEKLWQMVNLINYDAKMQKRIQPWMVDERQVFENLQKVCQESAGSAHYLLENLFEAEIFDHQDVEDMVLYMGQNAFGRVLDQERNELKPFDLQGDEKEKYLKNAEILGFITELNPTLKQYDESWIQGAAKLRMQSRIQYWRDLCDKNQINPGQVKFLTGNRELWLEIDKLPGESLEQAQEFFLRLAQLNGIAVNQEEPFKKRSDGRTYLNYAEGETNKITETKMAQMMFRDYFNSGIENIVDSQTLQGRARPDTESGANAAYDEFVSSAHYPNDRKPNIIIISNQPYCDRQLLTVESAIAKKSGVENSFNLEVCGAENEVGVTAIHSEFGALIAECYMKQMRQYPTERKRSPNQMMFQTRSKLELAVGETFGENVVTRIVKPTASNLAETALSDSINNLENVTKTRTSR